MRILFATPVYPFPPHRTGAHRRFHSLLKHLTANHRSDLLLLDGEDITEERAGEDLPGLAGFERVAWKVPHSRFLSRYFHLFWRYDIPAFKRALQNRLREEDYDLVYAFWGGMALHGGLLRRTAAVIDTVDAHSLYLERRLDRANTLRERWRLRHEIRQAHRFERRFFPLFDGWFTVAPRDTERIREGCPGLSVWTIPVAVDHEYFKVSRKPNLPPTIIFSGKMDFPDNADAAVLLGKEILPRIQRAIPETRLILAGGSPIDSVRALASRPGITVTGFVEDLRSPYAEASVMVSPLISGSGIKCKVMEALCMETPVVLTSLAAEGFEGTAPEGVIIRDDPELIAEATIDLLRNPAKAAGLGRDGRRYVIENFSEDRVCKRAEEILIQLAGGGKKTLTRSPTASDLSQRER